MSFIQSQQNVQKPRKRKRSKMAIMQASYFLTLIPQ